MSNYMMQLLWYLCMLEISAFSMSCAGLKSASNLDCFMNVEMKLPHDALIQRNTKDQTILLLKGNNLSEELEKDQRFKTLQSKNQYTDMALAFMAAYHGMFQLAFPPQELAVTSVQTDDLGFTHIKFQQQYKAIPVWAAEINLHFNPQNHIYLIQGRYIPTPLHVTVHPVLSENQAMHIVAENLKKTKCPGCGSELIIYHDEDMAPCLAYLIKASLSPVEGWDFFIDAMTGNVLKKLPTAFNSSTLKQQKHIAQ